MADKILFPGTEMEVFEKYPDSRRLDHPDFGDVVKTPYALGVITDFEKISDDPIQVKSRVKVRGEWGDSGFIPLFFKPKVAYWDPDSQKYNEGDGNFEKAWMSFRGDDEVAVMLKEGVPVAVMGFADGVSRVGENIFKMVWEAWPVVPPYPESELHPSVLTDGEGERFAYIQAVAAPGTPFRAGAWLQSPIPSNEWTERGSLDVISRGPDDLDLGLKTQALILCETPWKETFATGVGWNPTTANWHYKYMEHLIRLGPKLYILQIMAVWVYYYSPGGTYPVYPYPVYPAYGHSNYNCINYAILAAVDNKELIESTIRLGKQHSSLSPEAINRGDYTDLPDRNTFLSPAYYPGFSYCPAAVDGFRWYLNSYHSQFSSSSNPGIVVANPATLKIYTRPHTKVELQAAGMWPGNGVP